MSYIDNQNIQELDWEQVKSVVKSVNLELHNIIDEWAPSKRGSFLRVKYQYGDILLKDGVLHLPNSQGKLYPITHSSIPESIKQKLTYSSFPLGIITKGGNEVCLETDERVVSLAFFDPGVTLGLWETLDSSDPHISHFPKKIWNVHSGARSLYMLPKISEANGHNRLRKIYGIKTSAPKSMFDQARVFVELSKAYEFKYVWSNEIIFFTNKWIEQGFEKIYSLKLQYYLLKEAWNISADQRNQVSYDCIWQLFAKRLERLHIKIGPYIMDTMKHLLAIGLGSVPGFKPVGAVQNSGPTHGFQEVYVNDYGLKWYAPTIMEPCHFLQNKDVSCVYYSLQTPTILESSPRNNISTKLIAEMRKIKSLMEIFYECALNGELRIENTILEWLVNNIEFDYFHSEKDIYNEVRLSNDMPKEDPYLIYKSAKYKNSIFAECSPFVKGCVRIAKIKQ